MAGHRASGNVVLHEVKGIVNSHGSTIADGRGTTAAAVNETFGRGRSFLAKEARTRGMIDEIRSSNSASSDPNSRSANAEEDKKMDLKTLKAEHPAVYSAACSEAVTAERDRVRALLIIGDASGKMKTALSSVLDGSEITQTLQAEYMAAGLAKRDTEARGADDKQASDALDAKADAELPGADDSEQATYDEPFAAELAELRGSDVTA